VSYTVETVSGSDAGNTSYSTVTRVVRTEAGNMGGYSSVSIGGTSSGSSRLGAAKRPGTTGSARYTGRIITSGPTSRSDPKPLPKRTLSGSFVSAGTMFRNGITGLYAADAAGGVAYKDVLGLSVGSKVYWVVLRTAHQVHIGVAGPTTAHNQPPGESDNPGVALVTSAAPYVAVANTTTPVGSAVPTTIQVAVEILTTTSLRVWWYTLEGGLLAGPVDWACGETWAPFIYLGEVAASAWLDDGRNGNSFSYL
jgi:hypothetical protein